MSAIAVILGIVVLLIASSASIGYCLGYSHAIDDSGDDDDNNPDPFP